MKTTPQPSLLIPVILAGGSGQRLWPLSRTEHPKPFLTLSQGGTLFGKTVARAAALPGVETILTVTAEPLLPMSRSQAAGALSGADHKIQLSFLAEPVGRGTAASIALAALWARQRYSKNADDAILLVLPADHLVEDQEAFAAAVQVAVACAAQQKLVTFGVSPTRIETGFGYIEAGQSLQENDSVDTLASYDIARFIEKPSEGEAQQLIAQGRAFWNAGMFCFRVGDVCEAFARHAETLWNATQHAWQKVYMPQPDVWALEQASFSQAPKVVFDRAIMEKTRDGAVVCGAFDWNDIGSWTAWTDRIAQDRDGNRLHGDVIAHASRNMRVYAESRLVATVGVDDLIVAETADAVLIAHRDHVQEVRAVTAQLAEQGDARCHTPNTVRCPWGRYTVLRESAEVKVKEIEVAPGEALSLQRHQLRSEHWVVTQGIAKVTRDEESFLIQRSESAFIPAGVKHRLENPGETPLVIIEVQCGSYFGEDDIERFDDAYGRIENV
ncbi:MAG: mannose-1-phosphate guanylyltransferase/mannose-6-phosphate isomerase [Burkholderiales bacterium]|jgi:mannose-1-phosphate guanylyltransferase/mannose-6-phosphate isomerase|nr:mannose-1-phosphate guanylyltransferase/mannose-6-phosphate isomerase [Burkholderiales bacterium]